MFVVNTSAHFTDDAELRPMVGNVAHGLEIGSSLTIFFDQDPGRALAQVNRILVAFSELATQLEIKTTGVAYGEGFEPRAG